MIATTSNYDQLVQQLKSAEKIDDQRIALSDEIVEKVEQKMRQFRIESQKKLRDSREAISKVVLNA